MILLFRLQDGDIESRIWPSQFGFRATYGTSDALFAARRIIEQYWSKADGSIILLALDWAKAFDSISPYGLCNALHRFGLPDDMVVMIQSIYSDRNFTVRDSGVSSSSHSQAFGISQGCPLSPVLFSILMTLVMNDAKIKLEAQGWKLTEDLPIHDLLYADDTLLIEIDVARLTVFMKEVEACGAEYGLALNFKKVEALPV